MYKSIKVVKNKSNDMYAALVNKNSKSLEVHFSSVYNFWEAFEFNDANFLDVDVLLANIAEECEWNVEDLVMMDYDNALLEFQLRVSEL